MSLTCRDLPPTEVDLVLAGHHRPPLSLQPSTLLSCLPQVDEGGRAPLSLHHFFATDDHDNLHGDAVIKLSALPKYGCIENTGTGNRSGFAGERLKGWKQGVGDILIKPGHGELK